MEQIPSWVYYTIGSMIVVNLGTIFAVLTALFKGTWWLASKFTNYDKSIEKHSYDINAAHQKIRDLDEHIRNN